MNLSLIQTNASLYYTQSNFTDVNCDIGQVFTLNFQFDVFKDTVINLFKTKILYKEFENSLCPLGLYNTSLVVYTGMNVHDDTFVLNQFETSKY